MEANNWMEASIQHGPPRTLETAVAGEFSAAVGKAATAETPATAVTLGRKNIDKNTLTAGPTATQETNGTAGEPTTAGRPKSVVTSVDERLLLLTTVGTPQQELQGGWQMKCLLRELTAA
jgi:hypothetical protein